MKVFRATIREKRKATTLAAIAALLLSSCPAPVGPSAGGSSNGEAAAISVSIFVPSSRTATASPDDFAAAIASLALAVVDGTGTTVAAADGIAYAPGVVRTFGSLIPGAYTITVNAYDSVSALIATGSSPVAVTANSNQNVTVNLNYSQGAVTGDFSLAFSWPVSTGLGYVSATLDGAAIALPTVAADATNYTATLAASNLSGGAHRLDVSFKTSAGATISVGPFVEMVNIWDGVMSTCWIDAAGNPVHTRTFAATDFSSSNADLAGLAFTGASPTVAFAPGTTSYTLTGITGSTFSFIAEAVNGSQNVAYTWNGIAQTWNAFGATTFTSNSLVWVTGANTLQIVVTAPDRHTTKTYAATANIVNSTGVIIGIPSTPYQALTFADTAPTITQGQSISFQTSNATLAAVTSGWTWYIDGNPQGEMSQRLTLSAANTGAMLGSYMITARVTYGGVTYSGGFILTVRRPI